MKKLYYSIREVSLMVDEEQHTLRYWEKEFPQLKPKKNPGGNRKYDESDLETIKAIRHLIREEKLSLKGVKEQLNKILLSENQQNVANKSESTKQTQIPYVHKVDSLKSKVQNAGVSTDELLEISRLLRETLNYLKS